MEALERLFGQLLDLSRLDAGVLRPEVRAVALQPVLTRIARDFAAQANAAGLAFRTVPTGITVLSDPVLLERILRNLAANALRYTREGGIVMGVRRRGRSVRIDVIDSGIGIAPADQERIFEDFVQVGGNANEMRRGHGLGLGLAIVRRLSTLLGHALELESAPGRGSRFSVLAPLAPQHRARSRACDPGPAPVAAEAASELSLRGCHVVVIDDDPAVIAAMQALFATWGADVTAGRSSDEVRRELQQNRVPRTDLIVADLRLAQGASGLNAIAEVRAAPGHDAPAIVVSGDTTDAARAEVAQAGIALLQKPVIAAELNAAAQRALGATVGS